MSDMYLDLRTRIAVVADQTRIGTQRLNEAQKLSGLSNEAIARRIPISEKTWRRWKQAGQIPTASLPAIAEILKLDLRSVGEPTAEDERLDRLEAQLETVLAVLEELRAELREAARVPPVASPRHR